MTKIAVLGPKDTFSDVAVQKYLSAHSYLRSQIMYQKTIRLVFEELSAGNCDLGVVPIKNSSMQEKVPMTCDGLEKFSVDIIEELILPVQYSFLSKCERGQIKKIFVHPVAQQQCLSFLREYQYSEIVYTDSNMDSFNKLSEHSCCAAIVPCHILDEDETDYKLCVRNIADDPNNNTRFIVLKKSNEAK